jgi:hypothetical protein
VSFEIRGHLRDAVHLGVGRADPAAGRGHTEPRRKEIGHGVEWSPADLVHVPGTAHPTVVLVVNASFDEALAPPDAGLLPRPSLVKLSLP